MDRMENLTIIHTISLIEFVRNESSAVDNNDETYALPTWINGVLLALYSAFMLISIGGNILVCTLIWLKKQLRTAANHFVISLALSDIIMVILCVPFTVLTNLIYFHWIFGAFLCPVVGYLQLSSVIQRSFVLVAAAADRHQAVWRPMHKHLSKKGAMILIGAIWLISLVIPLPIAMYSKLQTIGSKQLCVEEWSSTNGRVSYGIAMMVMTYAMPLGVLFFTYAHIVSILGRKAPGENAAMRDMRRLCSKTKTIKTMIYVVMAYLVCWLPIHLITVIGDLDPSIFNSKTVHVMWLFFHFLAMSNSASNPLLYFTTDTIYRQNFLGLFRKRRIRDHGAEHSTSMFELIKRRISLSVGNISDVYVDYKRRSTEILDLDLIRSRIRLSPSGPRKASVAYV